MCSFVCFATEYKNKTTQVIDKSTTLATNSIVVSLVVMYNVTREKVLEIIIKSNAKMCDCFASISYDLCYSATDEWYVALFLAFGYNLKLFHSILFLTVE